MELEWSSRREERRKEVQKREERKSKAAISSLTARTKVWCLREEGGHPSPKRKRDRDWLSFTIATPPKRQREEGVEGVVEGVVEGIPAGCKRAENMTDGWKKKQSKIRIWAKPSPVCRADTIVSSCSVAEVAAKEPEESGNIKLSQNVNKPSVAMPASKNDCHTTNNLNISEKKTTVPKSEAKSKSKSTSKTITRPKVKTKKWVRKKNGLFGWVTCVSAGNSVKLGSMGSNFDGEEAKKESAAGDSITKDLEGTESC